MREGGSTCYSTFVEEMVVLSSFLIYSLANIDDCEGEALEVSLCGAQQLRLKL